MRQARPSTHHSMHKLRLASFVTLLLLGLSATALSSKRHPSRLTHVGKGVMASGLTRGPRIRNGHRNAKKNGTASGRRSLLSYEGQDLDVSGAGAYAMNILLDGQVVSATIDTGSSICLVACTGASRGGSMRPGERALRGGCLTAAPPHSMGKEDGGTGRHHDAQSHTMRYVAIQFYDPRWGPLKVRRMSPPPNAIRCHPSISLKTPSLLGRPISSSGSKVRPSPLSRPVFTLQGQGRLPFIHPTHSPPHPTPPHFTRIVLSTAL